MNEKLKSSCSGGCAQPCGKAKRVALEHGVDIELVVVHDKQQRLELLRSILRRKDVPHPIDPATANRCYKLAESGIPFGIGSLSNKTVELEQFANTQVYENITFEDHVSWACLVADQQTAKHEYACCEYLLGEELFEIGGNVIPDYYILNARIYQQTGWQLATVNEIIPAEIFFHCHSHKFFPVTTFMRPLGTDYLEEPDIGHDIAGHVATFTIAQVAQVMNNHGLANDMIHFEKELKLKEATTDDERQQFHAEAKELLLYAGRIYWFTVEFGLVLQQGDLKAFGAGILSSPGETKYSIDSREANRVLVDVANDRDLLRLATTDYLISEFQKTYFVLKDFDSLASLTPQRIVNTVHTAQRLPHHTWLELVPGDHVFNVGKSLASTNEKYHRLLADQYLDECTDRVAIRNLRMFMRGMQPDCAVEREFVDELPPLPAVLIEEFARADAKREFDVSANTLEELHS